MMVKNAGNRIGTSDPVMSVGRSPLGEKWLAGYRDASNGRPFRHEYDTWPPQAQRQYEIARLIAVNMLSAGIKPPPLRVHRTHAYVAAYHQANETVGMAHDVARVLPESKIEIEVAQTY